MKYHNYKRAAYVLLLLSFVFAPQLWGKSTEKHAEEQTQEYRKLKNNERIQALGKAGLSLAFMWLISPITYAMGIVTKNQVSEFRARPRQRHFSFPLLTMPGLIAHGLIYTRCGHYSYIKIKEAISGKALIDADEDENYDDEDAWQ